MKLHKLLFDFLLPRSCAVCGTKLNYHEKHLCLECYADLPLTYFWSVKDTPAERVFWGRCMVERVYPLLFFTNNYRNPIHLLKYHGNTPLGLYFGEMLGNFLPDDSIDFIVPVPLHWRKRVLRGYNQSEIIAKGIARGCSSSWTNSDTRFCPTTTSSASEKPAPSVVGDLLRRRQFTKTQTAKDRINRWENVRRAFEVNPKYCRKSLSGKFTGKHILLVDDVLTTGATLEACCSILQEKFRCKVSIATLAYVE